jgi:hypothetical protein
MKGRTTMGSLIPLTSSNNSGLTPLQAVQGNRAYRRAAVQVFNHDLQVTVDTEIDRIDSQAIADVIRTATEEELLFLDYGLAMAGNSAAKTELVARKVELLSNINNRRITRRFGR